MSWYKVTHAELFYSKRIEGQINEVQERSEKKKIEVGSTQSLRLSASFLTKSRSLLCRLRCSNCSSLRPPLESPLCAQTLQASMTGGKFSRSTPASEDRHWIVLRGSDSHMLLSLWNGREQHELQLRTNDHNGCVKRMRKQELVEKKQPKTNMK